MNRRQFGACNAALAVAVLAGWTLPVQGALIAQYSFDDGTANDSTANAINGMFEGAAAAVADGTRPAAPAGNQVLELDGDSANYVSIADPGGLLDFSTTGNATVAAWVRGPQGQTDWKNHSSIFSQGEWNDGASLTLKGDVDPDGAIWAGKSGDNTLLSDAAPAYAQWQHVAATWSYDGANTTVTFYLNGVATGYSLGDPGTLGGTIVAPVNGISRIGLEDRNGDGSGARWAWAGRIDEVRVYDEVLSADQIARLAVPEPTSLAIELAGFFGLVAVSRKR